MTTDPAILKHEEHLQSLYSTSVPVKQILLDRASFYDRLIEEALVPLKSIVSLDEISLIATGSYGRQEMNRHSDIDLQILHEGLDDDIFLQLEEKFLHPLLSKGINIAVMRRNIDKPIKDWNFNLHEQTVFFETRFICGNTRIYKNWHDTLTKHWEKDNNRMKLLDEVIIDYKNFLKNAQENSDEPNIKKMKGGIREYTFFLWINRISGNEDYHLLNSDEIIYVNKAIDFLWLLRDAMHSISGFCQDTLTKELQTKIYPSIDALSILNLHTKNLHDLFYAKIP